MRFRSRQKGMGVGGWLLMILIIGGGVSIGLKLVPVYMDHNTMNNVLTKMASEDGHGSKLKDHIRDEIRKRFRVNNIRDFNLRDNLRIERDAEGTTVVLDYQTRVPLVANVELVATFTEQYRLQD